MGPDGEAGKSGSVGKLLWLLVPVSLMGGAYAADQLYRRAISQKLSALEKDLRASHAEDSYRGAEYSRFGVDLAAPESSLFADFHAWGSKRVVNRSKLDYDIGGGMTLSHAFLLAAFRFDHGGSPNDHVFIWSPRKREFVHHANWGYPCQVRCRWRRDPECVSRCD